MPYEDGKFPHTWKNIDPDVRSKAVSILNALLKDGMDEGEAIATALTKAREWVAKHSADDALASVRGVEIFSPGTHNGDTYTERDIDDMLDAYQKLDFRPALKIGHVKDAPGSPAYGWVTNLRKDNGKLVADFESMHPSVVQALRDKRYDRVSSEIYFNLKRGGGHYRRALKAVALLGAEVPAVAGLVPLHKVEFAANEDEYDELSEAEGALEATVDEFGDKSGHPFRGNQWTSGKRASTETSNKEHADLIHDAVSASQKAVEESAAAKRLMKEKGDKVFPWNKAAFEKTDAAHRATTEAGNHVKVTVDRASRLGLLHRSAAKAHGDAAYAMTDPETGGIRSGAYDYHRRAQAQHQAAEAAYVKIRSRLLSRQGRNPFLYHSTLAFSWKELTTMTLKELKDKQAATAARLAAFKSKKADAMDDEEKEAMRKCEEEHAAYDQQIATLTRAESAEKQLADLAAARKADAERIANLEAQNRAREVEAIGGRCKVPAFRPAIEALANYALQQPETKVAVFAAPDKDGKRAETQSTLVGVVEDLVSSINNSAARLFSVVTTGHNSEKPEGESDERAGVELDRKAKAYATQHKVGYVDAMDAVLAADAALAKRYHEEQNAHTA